MDKDFEKLIDETRKIAGKKILSEYASYGHVGCALMTDKGNIYTIYRADDLLKIICFYAIIYSV